jgi:hypothetical protein
MELVGRDVIDQLREDDAADMHASACSIPKLAPNWLSGVFCIG